MSVRSKCYVGRYSVAELFLRISVSSIRVKHRSLYYINFMGNSGLAFRFSSIRLSPEEMATYATSIIQTSLAIAVYLSFEIPVNKVTLCDWIPEPPMCHSCAWLGPVLASTTCGHVVRF